MKRFLLSFTLLLLCMTGAWAYDFQVDGICYNIISGTENVEVTSKYTKYSGSVVIPETVTNNGTVYSVTSIGDRAFYYCSGLTSVTIPNSVTSIGGSAFEGCSGLTSVEWNAKKCADFDWESRPFYGCTSITTFTFGNDVEHIPAELCGDLTGLTSVTIPSSVTSIGEDAFWRCSGLTSVEWNAKKCADFDWKSRSFGGCTSITTFTFGNDVEHIPACLCYHCSGLTSVIIPNSVTSIGGSAFEGCSGLTSVTIPNSVTSIGGSAFEGCSGLTSVTIPNSVTSIGGSAFEGCSGLTSVTIPNSVTSIGDWAFSSCSGLTSVTIPNSVTSIGDRAFYGCSGLTSVEWNAKRCADFDLDYYRKIYPPFYSCFAITTFTFGNEVKHIPAYLCYNRSGLTSVIIPNSVTSIGNSAFSGCSGLTSVTIPNSVTTIGDQAFYECSGLSSVTIPNSVTSIGEYVFYDTRIPTPVYNETVFAYMPVIHEGGYAVPDGIKSVAGGAFYECTDLTSVTIPNSVTSIGYRAFSLCSGLKSVYVYASEPPVLEYDILGYGEIGVKFYVPEASLEAYKSAEVWKGYFIFPMSDLEMFTVTVSSNDAAMGTVSGGGEYNKGATATLTATANEGYRFVKWSDGKTDNPRVIIVNENITLTAEFAKEITAVDTPDESSVTVIAGDGTITVYGAEGETVTVYNVHGTCVYHGTGNEPTEIQVSTAGVYIVRTKGATVKVAVR